MAEVKQAHAVGFNHVALEVGDIEEALAFYRRLFDFKLRGKSATSAFIDLGDQFLALQKGRTQPADEGRHFGLVVDDKDAVRKALTDAGIKPLPGPFLDFLDPWGNRNRDCQLRERPIHQGAKRAARHGIDPSIKERRSDPRTDCEGHGAELEKRHRQKIAALLG